MDIDIISVGPIQTNSYLVTCRQTREALLVDPGWEDDTIQEAIDRRDAHVRYVVNTHAHWDHIGGNARYVESTGAPLLMHEIDLPLLHQRGGAALWDIPLRPSPEPDRFLDEGDVLEVGGLRFAILFTPGHTPGHISLYEAEHGVLLDGDVLFRRGIGRTDLPGGDQDALYHSIRNVLFALPADVVVYPGHGEPTTIGEERDLNPWLG